MQIVIVPSIIPLSKEISMAKRGKTGQTRHDAKVQQRMKQLQGQGFRVWADLPGRGKPPKVGGRIPDIYARRGKDLVVEEVETPGTLKSDKQQQEMLREGTTKRGGRFTVRIAK
jgi:hypothetical protein